jgi:hypothetical protein
MNNSIYSERYMNVLAIANSNFEHPSTVESWYYSTREHENYFASHFRRLKETARHFWMVYAQSYLQYSSTVLVLFESLVIIF